MLMLLAVRSSRSCFEHGAPFLANDMYADSLAKVKYHGFCSDISFHFPFYEYPFV